MATRCCWGEHDVKPDPAASARPVGTRGLCLVCRFRYVVTSVAPYVVGRLVAAGAALAPKGGAAGKRYEKRKPKPKPKPKRKPKPKPKPKPKR